MKKLYFPLVLTLFWASYAHPQQASKSYWISFMKHTYPASICQEGEYFRNCFDVSMSECLDIASQSVDICLEQGRNDIPDMIDHVAGEKWGFILGACAGKVFEKRAARRRNGDVQCTYSSFR